jgi:ATP-dependent protease ClpP protease subunit
MATDTATQSKSWYTIRQRSAVAVAALAAATGQPAQAEAEILIYADIGESWWSESVSAAQFVRELAAIDASRITVRINSLGGSVPDGIAIHNALKRHPATVTTVVDAMALSIASLVALAGDVVEIADNAVLMIHAPWTGLNGNAVALREAADQCDIWAEAMAASYAAKSGKTKAEMVALMADGKDHWFTAEEALAQGFADAVVTAIPMAASASRPPEDFSRFRAVPEPLARLFNAAAAAPSLEQPMPVQQTPAATTTPAASQVQHSVPSAPEINEAQAAGVRLESERRTGIQASFAMVSGREGMEQLRAQCENDVNCSVAAANQRILAALGAGSTPAAGHHVVVVEDEADKFRAAASQAIMARAGIQSKDGPIRASTDNPLRGHRLLDIARASLQRIGVNTNGMDQMQVVAAAFTQGTSDFPILLENTMHKTLLTAYAIAADTWSRFCKRGSVSDFRAHKRYRVGSLSNLESKNELGEFRSKSIPDGERATITAGTKGNIINISREAIINDDLEALTGLAAALGRAAKRTIEADVYATLALNSGLGPVLEDGLTLFHATHGNIPTAAVPSVDSFDAGRVLMAQQKDVNGNDYLDLRPAIWLGPIGLGGTARVINNAEYDPDTANKLQRPNKVRGLVRDIVDTPRLSGTAWHLFADPAEAPALEVAFLDGNSEPYLELQNGFTVDGAQWKARLDYGVAGIDYRGAIRNAG